MAGCLPTTQNQAERRPVRKCLAQPEALPGDGPEPEQQLLGRAGAVRDRQAPGAPAGRRGPAAPHPQLLGVRGRVPGGSLALATAASCTRLLFQFLPFALEYKAIDLIFEYIDLTKNKDVRLALDALKVP